MVMVLAPGPIIAGSIGFSNLARSDRPAPLATKEVLGRHFVGDASAAAGARESLLPVEGQLIADCEAQRARLAEQLGAGCAVIAAPPFVLGGDLSAEELDAWQRRTIAPAATAMGERYFTRRPNEPITVLLFASQESYERHAYRLYRDRGVSIYGYYKPRERALVMNIATGGGTLVHELTHALIAFDCPRVPDWFNEGLASLHEQCRFAEDERGPWIEGLVNWRLPHLQKELAADRLPALADFIRGDDFRGEREGVNYAVARYLCLMLQRRGQLEAFYAALRDRIDDDPHGAEALRAAFPGRSWPEIDAEFREFVRTMTPIDSATP
jgi:hypothetical protein